MYPAVKISWAGGGLLFSLRIGVSANAPLTLMNTNANKTYEFSVAQISNLPYRRFVICGASESSNALALADVPQNAILRYSRLQICATLNTYRRDTRALTKSSCPFRGFFRLEMLRIHVVISLATL
jgi:hypothetical protein